MPNKEQCNPEILQNTSISTTSLESIQDFWQKPISRRSMIKGGFGLIGAAFVPNLTGCEVWQHGFPTFPEFVLPDRDQYCIVQPLIGKNQSPPVSIDHIQKRLRETQAYFNVVTRGMYKWHYTVEDWATVEDHFNPANTDLTAISGDNILQQKNNRDLSRYQTRMYITAPPPPNTVDFAGKERDGSDYDQIWMYMGADMEAENLEHEELHKLGLKHIFLVKPSGLYEYSDTSSGRYYGRAPSKMGFGNGYVDIPQLVQLGVVKENQIQTITPFSVNPKGYDIYPQEKNDGENLLGLRFQKPDTNEIYYISLEDGTSYDDSSDITPGLKFYVWDETTTSDMKQVYPTIPDPFTRFTDSTLELMDGESFRDDGNGILVTRSHKNGDGSVKVMVNFSKH